MMQVTAACAESVSSAGWNGWATGMVTGVCIAFLAWAIFASMQGRWSLASRAARRERRELRRRVKRLLSLGVDYPTAARHVQREMEAECREAYAAIVEVG